MDNQCFCGNVIQPGNEFICNKCERSVCIPCVMAMDGDIRCPEHNFKKQCFCGNTIEAAAPEHCGRCNTPICIPCRMTMTGDLRCPTCAVEDAEDAATLALVRRQPIELKRRRVDIVKKPVSAPTATTVSEMLQSVCSVCGDASWKRCPRECGLLYCMTHYQHACDRCDSCCSEFAARAPRISCTLCQKRVCRECWDTGHNCLYLHWCRKCHKTHRRRLYNSFPVVCAIRGCMGYSCPTCDPKLDMRLPATLCQSHIASVSDRPCAGCHNWYPDIYRCQLVVSKVIPMNADARYVAVCTICRDRLDALRMTLWKTRTLPRVLIDQIVVWACLMGVCK